MSHFVVVWSLLCKKVVLPLRCPSPAFHPRIASLPLRGDLSASTALHSLTHKVEGAVTEGW